MIILYPGQFPATFLRADECPEGYVAVLGPWEVNPEPRYVS